MRAIFISYRREDAEGHAGRLFEDLVQRFGASSVFMDVADIEPGRDFRRVIEQQVASCGVLLAVIGKSWLDVTDAQGRRRLDDPVDFVCLETTTALKRDIPVIPVLVHGASMPRADQLPDALKDLAYRNSVELTHARWSSDVQLLIRALMPYVDLSAAASMSQAAAAPRSAPATPIAARTGESNGSKSLVAIGGVLALGAVAGIGYVLWERARAPATAPPPAIVVADSGTPAASQAAAPKVDIPTAMPAPSSAPTVRHHPPAPVPAPAQRPADTVVAAAPAAVASPAPSPAALPAPVTVPPVAAPVPDANSADADPTAIPSRADPALAIYGERVKVTFATRTIVITPTTNYVNVTGGEIVRFAVGNKAIAWNFNGRSGSFDLERAAPALIDHKVTAYIAPNPYYPRSGG